MWRKYFYKVLLVIVAIFAVLMLSGILSAQGNSGNAFDRVKEVQEKHTARLMAIKGVVGTAVGVDIEDKPNIKVFVEEPGVAGIPKKLDEVAVDVVVTGKIYAIPASDVKTVGETKIDPTAWFDRPVPIGVSTGTEGPCAAGTIACRVKDRSGKLYALSNNHVYALENTAELGSKVLQPGLYDTHCVLNENNVIGTLFDFVPIKFDGSDNIVDAAIAAIIKDGKIPRVGNATPSNGYGTPKSETVLASIGMPVQKYGRTTSLTKGTITGINATLDVNYHFGTARCVNQVIVESRTPFVKPGDSGSLMVTDPSRNPVGLIFAADSNGKFVAASRIELVLDAFDVTIDGE
jgi:hypothetical protein